MSSSARIFARLLTPKGKRLLSYAVDLKRDTAEQGAYPIVLVSYELACTKYPDANTAALVKSWLTYVVSEDGQKVAANAAGSAPISSATRDIAMKGINAIS